jgi:hypothetical protein
MRFKTLERLMFGLFGRTAPVTRVSDIDADGKIHTIHFLGEVKERDNSRVYMGLDGMGERSIPRVDQYHQ